MAKASYCIECLMPTGNADYQCDDCKAKHRQEAEKENAKMKEKGMRHELNSHERQRFGKMLRKMAVWGNAGMVDAGLRKVVADNVNTGQPGHVIRILMEAGILERSGKKPADWYYTVNHTALQREIGKMTDTAAAAVREGGADEKQDNASGGSPEPPTEAAAAPKSLEVITLKRQVEAHLRENEALYARLGKAQGTVDDIERRLSHLEKENGDIFRVGHQVGYTMGVTLWGLTTAMDTIARISGDISAGTLTVENVAGPIQEAKREVSTIASTLEHMSKALHAHVHRAERDEKEGAQGESTSRAS